MKYFIAILAFAALASAEIFDRPCRTPEQLNVKTDFDVPRYLGIWWEIERYEQSFQVDADCVRAQYTLNSDGSVEVFNSAFLIEEQREIFDIGVARVSFPDEVPLRAMLNVTFDPNQPNLSNYWVLSTDYFSYAFVVSCFNLTPETSLESYWLLSRTLELPQAARTRADGLIDLYLDRDRIRTTVQDNQRCNRP